MGWIWIPLFLNPDTDWDTHSFGSGYLFMDSGFRGYFRGVGGPLRTWSGAEIMERVSFFPERGISVPESGFQSGKQIVQGSMDYPDIHVIYGLSLDRTFTLFELD